MNNKVYILFFLLVFSVSSFAQYTLRIEIVATPSAHKEEGVFAAGNFNNWNPGDEHYSFSRTGDKLVLEIKTLAAKKYAFKFTRGDWKRTEATAAGKDVANREIELSSDTTITATVDGWKDDHATIEYHTASANVHVMDSAFFIPQLHKNRRIWVYLPPGYNAGKKHYPVMYLQDGQNLFDESYSAFGSEWGVDECIDSLVAKGKQGCIIVGIDNGGSSRMNEYNPYEFTLKDSSRSTTFAPQGNDYLDFITETLKPYIDKHYRTLSSKENTIIAGSSMGGLIAYYAALKYPDVFGKAGIFSPAFWTAPAIEALTDSATRKVDSKFFFYIGGKEGDRYVTDMNEVAEKLGAASNAMIYTLVDPEGKHYEAAWRKWFAEFYVWMMADGYNNVIKLEQ
ncbi:alpha/beta hydrolase [Ferruginibacter sp.]